MFRIVTVHPQELLCRYCMCRLPFIVMWMYLGVKCRSLQVLLYQIAAVHLHSFILIFSYICIIFACWAFMNLTLEGPCIIFCNIYTFQQDTQCSSTDCLSINNQCCYIVYFIGMYIYCNEIYNHSIYYKSPEV